MPSIHLTKDLCLEYTKNKKPYIKKISSPAKNSLWNCIYNSTELKMAKKYFIILGY